MRISFLILVFALTLSITPNAQAEETIFDMAESDQYGKKFGGMLGRGLLNVATCFVDLVVHTVEETKQGPPLVGTLTGLGSGTGCMVLRAGSGVVDVATSWVPGFNGFPVSRSYSDCLAVDASASTRVQAAPAKQAQRYSAAKAEPKHDPYKYVKK